MLEPPRGIARFGFSELWEYRELLYFLTWRDVKVRYKQTAIGLAWVVLQPLAMMAVFTVFFGKLARVPSDGVPYPLFAYSALLPWQLFARTLTESTISLVQDERMITKIYFPRLLVPTAKSVGALLDFGVAALLMLGLMALYGVVPTWRLVVVPALLAVLVLFSLGVGYWLSAVNLEFRDVKHAMPFLTQLWFFMTPVVYPASLVPAEYQALYALNPMVGVIEGFRWAFLAHGELPTVPLLVSGLAGLVVFLSGILWFRARERVFIDLVG